MLGKIVFCAGCLAVRGLVPLAPVVHPSKALTGGGVACSSRLCNDGSASCAHVAAASSHRHSSKASRHCHRRGTTEEGKHNQDDLLDGLEPLAAPDGGPAGLRTGVTATNVAVSDAPGLQLTITEQQQQQMAAISFMKSARTFVMGVVLACSILLASPPATISPAQAADSSQQQQQHLRQQQQQQQQEGQWFGMVAPRPPTPGKVRPPPPKIPEGRITIVQWCQKNVGRYVPKLADVQTGVRTAAETAEKIRVNSGPAPTAGDLRRMTGNAMQAKLKELSAAGRRSPAAAPVPNVLASAPSAGGALQAETPTDISSSASGTSSIQQEIDALKAEMLRLQQTPPSEPRRDAPRESSSSYFKVRLPTTTPTWFFNVDFPTMPKAEDKVASTDAAAETRRDEAEARRSKAKKRGTGTARRVSDVSTAAVDLKAELRAESEMAASKASSSSRQRTKKEGAGSEAAAVAAAVAAAGKYVAPAPLYEPTQAVPSLSSPAKGIIGGAPGDAGGHEQSGASSDPSSGVSAMGMGGVTVDARASSKKLDPVDVSEEGRASVGRLQAEADRNSAGVANLPEGIRSAGQSAGSRLSQLSGSVAAKLSTTARSAAAQANRGIDWVLPAVGEAGRAVNEGVSSLSKSSAVMQDQVSALSTRMGSAAGQAGRALSDSVSRLSKETAGGLPALLVEGRASALVSQYVETSSRVVSQAIDRAGEISENISGISGTVSDGLSSLTGRRGPELVARAKGAVEQLSAFGDGAIAAAQKALSAARGISTWSLSIDEQGDVLVGGVGAKVAATAVGVVVIAGGAAIAGGGGGANGAAKEGAQVNSAGGNAGGGVAVEGGEGRRLQAITGGTAVGEVGVLEGEGNPLQPVGAKLETGATNEGERHGEEAVSASGALWDMIRESGTGAGDAVREVSEEDLLDRAAKLGLQLRQTAEGLEVLKHEVAALRESIRESDLEGRAKTIRERLVSILEGQGQAN